MLGLGEAGLPLAVDLAGAGFTITAFDTDEALVASINNGRPQSPDVVGGVLEHLVGRGKFPATSETAPSPIWISSAFASARRPTGR